MKSLNSQAYATVLEKYLVSWTFNLVKYGSCSTLKRKCLLLKMISRVAYLNSQCAHYLVSISQKHLVKQIAFHPGSYGELFSTCAKGCEVQ